MLQAPGAPHRDGHREAEARLDSLPPLRGLGQQGSCRPLSRFIREVIHE